jgi:hypothetical protein
MKIINKRSIGASGVNKRKYNAWQPALSMAQLFVACNPAGNIFSISINTSYAVSLCNGAMAAGL